MINFIKMNKEDIIDQEGDTNSVLSEDFSYNKLRDQFACHAMLAVIQETQEMRIASFYDWIKQLLVTYLNFTFLTVKHVQVENVYEEAAKRAYQYADALLSARKNDKCKKNR